MPDVPNVSWRRASTLNSHITKIGIDEPSKFSGVSVVKGLWLFVNDDQPRLTSLIKTASCVARACGVVKLP